VQRLEHNWSTHHSSDSAAGVTTCASEIQQLKLLAQLQQEVRQSSAIVLFAMSVWLAVVEAIETEVPTAKPLTNGGILDADALLISFIRSFSC
jgi:hypothetical protein